MIWIVLLIASSSFTFGWAMCSWQCSRRQDCPRYNEYSLAKWKHDVESQTAQHRQTRLRRRSSTPPDGSKT